MTNHLLLRRQKKQKKSVRKIPPPIIPKVEDYEYPQEEQERLEMEFAQYRAQVTDCTVVLGRSCNSLCNEMANDLLGTSKIIETIILVNTLLNYYVKYATN